MKLCIDLCSGLGGFSQAFKDDPEWEVVTMDIEPKFKPTIVADVNCLPFKKDLKPDALLMSPPCERFSRALPQFPYPGIGKALSIVGACLEAVIWLKPKRWLLENPKGRLRWFIGKPPQTIRYSDHDLKYNQEKLTDFWGNIPFPFASHHRPIFVGRTETGWGTKLRNGKPSRENRAQIPLGVSQAVKQAIKPKKPEGKRQCP
jgi:site-specific DNA-cytosine methylase